VCARAVLSVTHSRGGVCGRQPGVSRGCAAEFRRQKYAEKNARRRRRRRWRVSTTT